MVIGFTRFCSLVGFWVSVFNFVFKMNPFVVAMQHECLVFRVNSADLVIIYQ